MKGGEEAKCDIRELQLLTNLLYEKSTPLEWFYPPIGKIASFSLRNEMAKVISRTNYDKNLSIFLAKNPGYKQDVPDYGQFMEAFFCAGVLPMTEAEKFLKSLAKSRNTFHGGKPFWIGYDTSALRRSFYSNIVTFLNSNNLENSIGHVVVGGVVEEIMQGMDQKYKSRKVAELAKGFPEASNFLNQPGLSGRLHRIGMAEIKNMKNKSVFHEHNSEKGDMEIIKGYEDFESDRNAEVLLFSADKNFVEMAVQKSLKTQYLDYSIFNINQRLQDSPVTLDVVSRILYYGTMVFGMTRLSGVDLYSIWRGKDVEDWNKGCIKVNVKGTLSKPFRKAHGALKDMKESGYFSLA
ncbi:hypothetical protein OAK07_01540 [Marine Group III euryarchaeote]|nr:hypothetical protein [Marine Group III euryarchaeote]